MSFWIVGLRLLLLQLFGRKSRRDGKGTLSVTGETRKLGRAEEDEEPPVGVMWDSGIPERKVGTHTYLKHDSKGHGRKRGWVGVGLQGFK